ncbi:hypothetical protein Bca52824_033155 [Brassica carinata]|uniref:Uncharacterized protein n=1 Tax=Brassica carinata TaxID=52824 RepID=A0A8X7SCB5_BRACI|nr:hypothetical protein Bca52824_033155 [Brassica carinata]
MTVSWASYIIDRPSNKTDDWQHQYFFVKSDEYVFVEPPNDEARVLWSHLDEGSRSIKATESKHKKQKNSKGDADPSATLQTVEKGTHEGFVGNLSEERPHKRKKKAEGQDGADNPVDSASGGGDGVAKGDTLDPSEVLPEKGKKKKKTKKKMKAAMEDQGAPVATSHEGEDAPLMIAAYSQSVEPLMDGRPITVPKCRSGSVRRVALDAGRLTFSKEYASASNAFVKLRDPMDIVVERYDATLARSQRSITARNAVIRKTRRERRWVFDHAATASRKRDRVRFRFQGEKIRADLLEDKLALAREATENVLKEKAQLEQENNRLERDDNGVGQGSDCHDVSVQWSFRPYPGPSDSLKLVRAAMQSPRSGRWGFQGEGRGGRQ